MKKIRIKIKILESDTCPTYRIPSKFLKSSYTLQKSVSREPLQPSETEDSLTMEKNIHSSYIKFLSNRRESITLRPIKRIS